MSGLILVALVILIVVVLLQIGRSSELVAAIQGEEQFEKRRNRIMAWIMLVIFISLMVFIYVCHIYLKDKLLPISASKQGESYDLMFLVTLSVTGIVFIITQFLLFWFAFKYYDKGNRKAFFFSHSNKLEMVWTTIPAIAMAILVAIGLRNWFAMTSPAPANAQIIEVIGKQFNWITRYPGKDGVLGKRHFTNINDENNILGLDWADPHTHDDIVMSTGEIRLIKDKPVSLIIGSRDVIHDVGLAHFRMKMDAVPGVTSNIWFTPTISTQEMKKITANPDFVYELSCDQMCGRGHFSMRAEIIVETQAEHDTWLATQPAYYLQSHPAENKLPLTTDSIKSITLNK